MSELCVFAGTSEGRRLLEFLAGQDVGVLACVATEYGEALVPRAQNIEVSAGRLDMGGMMALFAERRFDIPGGVIFKQPIDGAAFLMHSANRSR